MEARRRAPVTVVSGLPRSGTSLMMQMLEAGGLAALQDGKRRADAGNPHGYYELEAVRRLPRDTEWLTAAAGRAVKVIHALVTELPAGHRYRILWMERDLGEVARSQRALLEGLGRLPSDDLSDLRLAEILGQQAAQAARALDARPEVERLTVPHRGLLADPPGWAARIAEFVAAPLDVPAMAAVVDASLHRVRAGRDQS